MMERELQLSYYFSWPQNWSALGSEKEAVWLPLFRLESFFQKIPLGCVEVPLPSSVHLKNPSQISIGKGTKIEDGVTIQGPCCIGERCTLRQSAYLRGNVLIADDCVIGHGTEVKHSILLDHTYAAHFSYIGNTIVGSGVNLGAGVKCANFRLDGEEIIISWKEKKIATGMYKLGAIIGDGVKIGCNSVLNPGTFIGPNSHCEPLITLRKIIPPNSFLKKEEKISVLSIRNFSS